MRTASLFLTLCSMLVASLARAQEPYPSYNAYRAYRHFLTSPYSFRTYSGTIPGYEAGGYTRYGFQWYGQPPGYFRQEITPRGFSSYQFVPPGRGFILTPILPPPYPPPPYP
jgi:hypothetical protein